MASPTNQPTCVVVDDHPPIADAFAQAWEQSVTVVGSARTAQDGVAIANALQPEVVTMDVGLPGDPWAATRTIVEESEGRIRVLIVTGQTHPLIADQALYAGASGATTKGTKTDALVAALLRVAGGREHWDAVWADRVQAVRDSGVLDASVGLSDEEFRVLCGLAMGLTRDAISFASKLTVATVDRRIRDLKDRVGAETDAGVVGRAMSAGLLAPGSLV